MNVSFEEFYEKLTAHEIWFDQIKMRFFRKNLVDVAKECYLFLLASGNRWAAQDYEDFRRCYLNFLKNAKDAPIRPQLQQEETKKEESTGEPVLTGEARNEWIKKWLSEVQQMPVMKSAIPKLTYKEIADEGDWLPKKPAPYPSAPPEFLIMDEFKMQYGRECCDLYTGRLKPGMPSFEDWLKDKL